MKKNTRTPPRRSRVRNDTRSLVRSRPLQGVLALVAGLQVVAVAGGKVTEQRQTGPGLVREAMTAPAVVHAPPAVVQAPVKVARAVLTKRP